MAQVPFIDDSYIDEVIKSAEAYNPELDKTQGAKLRELIKLMRDRYEQETAAALHKTGDETKSGNLTLSNGNLTLSSGGVNVVGPSVLAGTQVTGNLTVGGGLGVTGAVTTSGLDNYTTNLSGSYTARSKVDKAYVDGVASGIQTSLGTKINATEKGAVNGVATLGADGRIPAAQIPAMAISDTFTAASQSAMLALAAEKGDLAVRTDINKTFILSQTPASTLSNWQELLTPTDAVSSVNGQTGVVNLSTSNITEGSNQYFTQARARSSVSAGTGISYNASTGVITNSSPNLLSNLALGTLTATTVPVTNSNGTGFVLPAATSVLAGLMIAADKAKLDAISSGATANQTDAFLLNRGNHTGSQPSSTISDFAATASAAAPVQSVAGKTGAVALVKADVGLGNADNTSDASKPVSTAAQAALNLKINTAEKGAVNGVATLGADGKIPSTQIPAIALSDTFTAASQTAMLALAAEKGDIAIRTDVSKTFILTQSPASTLSNWQEMLTPTDSVLSVNGQTGTVSLSTSNISEGSNQYFTSARVLSSVVSGFAAGANSTVTTSDTVETAIEKLQGQVNNRAPLTGAGTSGTWGISVSGNAATATALQTARTINGVSFNGTANITVEDNTKLPLAGGTVTGLITAASAPTAAGHLTNKAYVDTQDATKQNTLVSGTNIKTVNGTTLLGPGNITIVGASDLSLGVITATELPVNNSNGTGVTLPQATADFAGVMGALDKVKLDGVASGATANQTDAYLLSRANHTGTQGSATISDFAAAASAAAPVQSVAGRTGTVTLAKADVGLANADNTSDLNKPVSSATQTALNTKINATEKGTVNGVATLGADGKIPAAQIPAVALSDTFTAASQVAMLALAAEKGDIAVRTDLNKTFILSQAPASTLANWQELLTPTDAVISVNGQTGAVVLSSTNIAEGTNQYFTQTRARTAVGAGTGISYNSSTGVITNSSPNLPANLALGTLTATTLPVTNTDGTGFVLPAATSVLAGLMAAADKAKLDGVAAGATVNQTDAYLLSRANHTGSQSSATISDFTTAASAAAPVQSVAGKTGAVALVKADVGLGNADNTSDANKPVSSATQTALNAKINTTEKGAVNGVATLGADGKIPSTQIPSVAVSDTYTAISQAAMLALAAEKGDLAVRTDINKTFILSQTPASTLANWQELLTPTDTVLSVNGLIGAVSLSTSNISEGSNQYFTQARARTAMGAGSGIAYNSTTGVITNTTPNLPSNLALGTLTASTVPVTNSDGTGFVLPAATSVLAGLLAATDKVKMDSVASGATANQTDAYLLNRTNHTGTQGSSTISDFGTAAAAASPVQSVAGKTGVVALVKADVGLSDVDNTSDANKPVSAATQAVLNAKINLSEKGTINGVATLGADGKIPTAQIPAIALSDTFTAVSQAAMLALAAEKGDLAVRTDINKTFILTQVPASTLANWQELLTPTDAVLSVNGQTGAVSLSSTNIAEGTNQYFTQARARTSISAGSGIGYNSTTGVLTNSSPNLPSNLALGALTTTTVPVTNSDGTGFVLPAATSVLAGLMIAADKAKLDAMAAGATANQTDAYLLSRANHTGTQSSSTISDFATAAAAASPVQSVAGKSGAVTLAKADVGLGSVDNTSDANKPVSSATQTALNAKINLTEKGAVNGVATLGADGKIPAAQIPAVALSDTFTAATQVAMLALAAEKGDIAVRTDINKTFILSQAPASTLANWQELLTPTDAVSSVNGQTGAVTLSTTNIAEGSNQYFTQVRSRSALTAGTGISYNATTGAITNSSPNLPSNLALGTVTATTVPVTNSDGTGFVLPSATSVLAGLLIAADKAKLDGISAGATTNQADAYLLSRANHTGTQSSSTISDFGTAAAAAAPVQSVAGRSGEVVLTKTDVGLSNADNTSDASKPISTATQTALNGKINTTEKGAVNGVATLGADGKIPSAQIPAIALSETFTAVSQAAMLALTADKGDLAVRTDISKTFILTQTPASTLANWQELLTPTDAVLSVNGQTGTVSLSTSNITEGSNQYFTPARVLSSVVSGFTAGANSTVTVTDTVETAIEKLQGQVNNRAPLTGAGASGTWGISVSGNAATATALQTARTINGVAFNGSANITVEDSTKLPLAGGTVTGLITAASSPTATGHLTNKAYVDAQDASKQNALVSGTNIKTINGASILGAGDITTAAGTVLNVSSSNTDIAVTGGSTAAVLTLNAGTAAGQIVKRDTSGNIEAGSFIGALSGNANSSSILATSRNLWGRPFNGSGDVTGALTGVTNITGTGTADFSLFYGNIADSATAPSFAFTGDPNTGIWNAAADSLGFSTAGVNRLTLSTSALTSALPLIGTAATLSGNLSLQSMTERLYDNVSAGLNVFKDIKQYVNNNAAVAGNIKITLPLTPTTSTMYWMKVTLFEYDSSRNRQTIDLTISGYTGFNNANVWCNLPDRITQVRFGSDGTNRVIWIDTATDFAYPKVVINEFGVSHSAANAVNLKSPANYLITITADETGYVNSGTITNAQFKRDSFYQPAIVAGTTAQYYRGDKTWQDFSAPVRATALTGYVLDTNTPIAATDTVLSAFGHAQAQINNRLLLSGGTLTGALNGTSASFTGDVSSGTYLKSSTAWLRGASGGVILSDQSASKVIYLRPNGDMDTVAQATLSNYGLDVSTAIVAPVIYMSAAPSTVPADGQLLARNPTTGAIQRVAAATVSAWDAAAASAHSHSNKAFLDGIVFGATVNIHVTGNAATASVAAAIYNGAANMTFLASGNAGQPAFLWGTADGSASQLWNPTNFNVNSATKLTTARTINGVSFDGSANITVADATKIALTEKGAVNGVATLGADGKIPSSQIPALAIAETFTVASQAAMLALTAEKGDIAIRTDISKSFILTQSPASTLANWQELLSPTDAVQSVNGQTGTVTLSTTNITEGTNQYFTGARALATVISGFTVGANATVANTDTVEVAIEKLQGQMNAKTPLTGTGASGTWGISVTGNAATATALQTARTINGVAFNGSANIVIADSTKEPVISSGTTAQYLRGDKTWQSLDDEIRNAQLTGLVISPSSPVAAADTALAAFGKLQAQINSAATPTIAATLPATAGWYRIATSISGIANNMARFELSWVMSGIHGEAIFNAGLMYGQNPTINQTGYSTFDPAKGITQVRLVYHTTYAGNFAYLEVYNATAAALPITIQMFSALGWSLITPAAGSIPSGYTALSDTFQSGFNTTDMVTAGKQLVSQIATGTAPIVVASTTAVTNLNADMLDGQHAAAFQTAIAAGTAAQYYRGDKTWQDLGTDVRSTVLTGYAAGANAAVAATDTVTGAIGKLQGQINARPGTVTSVGLTVPTGLSVTGSPVTGAGTLGITLTSGYAIPTTAKQTQWDTAYTNNHAHANKAFLDTVVSGASLALSITGNAATATRSTILGLNPSGLAAAAYGDYTGILQDSTGGPESGSWSNRLKALHNNSVGYYTELAQNFTGTEGLYHRRNLAGVVSAWKTVLDSGNFNNYAPSLAGAGASGTWGISVNGNAATANALTTARSIWGQSFNGSGNISGALTGVTTISASGGFSGATSVFTGSGSDYSTGGIYVNGNGSANTIYPTIGFHQPSLYAASIQLRGGSDFRFYAQGAAAYAGITAGSGTFTGNVGVSGSLQAAGLSVGSTAGAGAGISLYGAESGTSAPVYGLMFAQTSNFGTFGSVNADWATYLMMNNTSGRGWIFKNTNSGISGNVASISNSGEASFAGHVTSGASPTSSNHLTTKSYVDSLVAGSGYVSSGMYLPVDMGTSSGGTLSLDECTYCIVGNVVTVFGRLAVSFDGTGYKFVEISLPPFPGLFSEAYLNGTAVALNNVLSDIGITGSSYGGNSANFYITCNQSWTTATVSFSFQFPFYTA